MTSSESQKSSAFWKIRIEEAKAFHQEQGRHTTSESGHIVTAHSNFGKVELFSLGYKEQWWAVWQIKNRRHHQIVRKKVPNGTTKHIDLDPPESLFSGPARDGLREGGGAGFSFGSRCFSSIYIPRTQRARRGRLWQGPAPIWARPEKFVFTHNIKLWVSWTMLSSMIRRHWRISSSWAPSGRLSWLLLFDLFHQPVHYTYTYTYTHVYMYIYIYDHKVSSRTFELKL